MYNKLVFFLIFTLNLSISQAIDLEEALKNGYNNDEQLKIIRSDFLNEIEQFPRALAGFMPRVSAGINATDSKITSKSNNPVAQNTSSNGSGYSKNLMLEQQIFNGGSNVAELKAAQSSFRASKGA